MSMPDYTARIATAMENVPIPTAEDVAELVADGCAICGVESFSTTIEAQQHAQSCWENWNNDDLQYISCEDEHRVMAGGRTYRQALEFLLNELYIAWDNDLERPAHWAPLF